MDFILEVVNIFKVTLLIIIKFLFVFVCMYVCMYVCGCMYNVCSI